MGFPGKWKKLHLNQWHASIFNQTAFWTESKDICSCLKRQLYSSKVLAACIIPSGGPGSAIAPLYFSRRNQSKKVHYVTTSCPRGHVHGQVTRSRISSRKRLKSSTSQSFRLAQTALRICQEARRQNRANQRFAALPLRVSQRYGLVTLKPSQDRRRRRVK